MELKKSHEGHTYVTLYDETVKRDDYYYGRAIEVFLEPDRFNIFGWTAGNVVKEFYDDFDLEEWLFVKLEHGRDLITLCCEHNDTEPPHGDYSPFMVLDTLHRIYGGQDDAFEQLKELMKENNFPHEFQFYA